MADEAFELNAAEEAPLSEEAVVSEGISEDEALAAKFDEISTEADTGADVEDPAAEPKTEEAQEDQEPKAAEPAPTDLPPDVQAVWKDLPESAQGAILKSQREMANKLATQGREITALAPMKDKLLEAIDILPGVAQMKPEELTGEIFALAQITAGFNDKPVETMMTLIQRNGLQQAVAQALGVSQGQDGQQLADLQKENRNLRAQIERSTSPEALKEHFSAWSAEDRMNAEINEFASSAEHWAAVEGHLPQFIAAARVTAPEGASNLDLLKEGYELAVSRLIPDAKQAKADLSDQDMVAQDPKRAEAAAKAKSANISGKRSGKPRELTEEEALSAAFDRAKAR